MNEFEVPAPTFEETFEEHFDVVARYAERWGAYQAGEDVAQEVMIRALRANNFDPQQAGPWLNRVARNILIDRHRAAQVRPQEASPQMLECTPCDAANYTEAVHDQLLAEQALAFMSTDQRAAVELVLIQGYSVAEAAEMLSVPLGTVKSRQHYGVKAAQAAFAKLGVEWPG